MAESHHHHHDSAGAPAGPHRSARVDTILASAGSRLLGVGAVCACMWAVLWLAVRAG